MNLEKIKMTQKEAFSHFHISNAFVDNNYAYKYVIIHRKMKYIFSLRNCPSMRKSDQKVEPLNPKNERCTTNTDKP